MSIYDSINFDKLVNIQLSKWRELRSKKMKKLDIEFFKALETNDDLMKEKISLLKKELRDITKFDFSILSMEEIPNYYPDCLK
jgi:hypothetical protein